MLRDFLASFRDYCYNETKNSRDHKYAEGAHGPMFIMGLILYFMPIPVWAYLLVYRFATRMLHDAIKANLIMLLAAGGLMFYLAFSISAFLFSIANQVPVDKDWSKQKLKDLRSIYLLVMVFGLVFFFAALWLPGDIYDHFAASLFCFLPSQVDPFSSWMAHHTPNWPASILFSGYIWAKFTLI